MNKCCFLPNIDCDKLPVGGYDETPDGFCDTCSIKTEARSSRLRQLSNWVNGDSVHDSKFDECCPDFSCCEPRIKTHKEERELFASLYLDRKYSEYEGMLVMFLGRAMPFLTDKKVYIAR